MDDNDRYALSTTTPTVCPYCGCTEFNDRWQDGSVFNFPLEVRTFTCGQAILGRNIVTTESFDFCKVEAKRRQAARDAASAKMYVVDGATFRLATDDEVIEAKEVIERRWKQENDEIRRQAHERRMERQRESRERYEVIQRAKENNG